ncbi:MAG: outer membrane beta-barrel protein [Flavobacteriales bacterium]|nr:outer membrane beta-barrel protein [Flavobacteriales bacterium]
MDSSSQTLPSASVVILQKSDSTLVNFGLSNDNGEFQISLSEKGEYLIQYSFLGYKSILVPLITSWEQKKILLPSVNMVASQFQLSEVNVTAERIPLQLKGDTLVYDAAAFKTRAGDDVEKLLELFPGISLDSEGNLIAQGKIVDKVLVNGKEFFGKNIETATKNLDALMVKRVEVFDKKSEDAEFTGVNDGNEKRTINLELKDEYKKGSFGKLEVAGGTEETYSGRINYNRFNKTTQSSIVGNTNNINQRAYQSITSLNSNSGSQGITKAINAGLNISHEFSTAVNASFNYSFLQTSTDIESKMLSQNFTDSTKFETNQIAENESKITEHRVRSNLKWKVNKLTETNIRTSINFSDRDALNTSSTLYDPPLNGDLVQSNTNRESDQFNFSTRLNLKRRFTKKGRSWLNSFQLDKTEKKEETNLFNTTFGQQLNQLQTFDETGISSRINSTYTEPINEKWFAKSRYSYSFEKNEPTRSFFDLESTTINFNDSLSSNFQRILNLHSLEVSINRNTTKYTSSAGVNARETNLQSSGLNRYFKFILPFLRLNYKIAPTKSVRFSYLTSSRTPQLSQLLTISNNINPNRSYIGNPELRPEFNHIFQINFYNFNTSNQLSYNAGISFNKTLNKIVTQTFVNEDFTSTNSPINTNFYESINIDGGLSGQVQQVNLRYRVNARANRNNYDAFLNGQASKVQKQSYSFRAVISRAKREKWDLNIGVNYSLNYSSFEVNSNFDQQSSNFFWFANGELEIFKNFLLKANYRIQRFNDVDFFDGRILHFVNATLKKSFKEGKWEAFILASDLFNQNIGIQRSSTINSLSEQTYNTRQQYFMFGLSKKIGAKNSKLF